MGQAFYYTTNCSCVHVAIGFFFFGRNGKVIQLIVICIYIYIFIYLFIYLYIYINTVLQESNDTECVARQLAKL